MPLTSGARLGAYEIGSPIGSGGMGEVYRARDTKLNRDVAIKVLLPAVANDPDRLARESHESIGIEREEIRQHLDGDVAIELRVASAIDLAHASGPERAEDLVRTEARAGGQGHRDS